MGKSTHFIGQPILGQLLNNLRQYEKSQEAETHEAAYK